MANVQVALRVRPLSKRETKEGGRIIVEVEDKVAKIRNLKVNSRPERSGDTREKVVAFGFDYCYWSVNPEDPQYASQEVVFQDLGTEVLSGAAKGYNICLFAYGQTGSGKTYTMLGTPASVGLTPRICEGLFIREDDCASLPSSRTIKVSFLEIYNERVRDLLKQSSQNKSYSLRVREHPEMGPYVQGLSQHVVTNYQQVIQLLEEGIANRITAATHVHEASSRSHAIFTIHYAQAMLQNNLPSETASKINLVDLAGSERADPSYCKDRITEGANINKSLVTLGIVISTLAQNSQVFSSCQSLSSTASSGVDSGIPSTTSGTSSGGASGKRQSYIPYRDSVLTWLLKESLGGNSRTIMVATVSPAHTSYSETMSTLRYASNAKNIINRPQVNEDASVKLIRELREEIDRLKAMLLNFELRNIRSLNDELDESLKEVVLRNDLKMDQLAREWAQKWNDWQAIMEHYRVDINRRRARVVIDSSLPHLMALEDDVLSTGVVLYHLKEGTTKIGRMDSDQEQDIVLQGQWIERDHCTITSTCGVVILRPTQGARCTVNGREVTASCRLTQGAVITLGKAQKFRFNHPAEAALLRHNRLKVGEALGSSCSLEWLDLDGDVTASRLGLCPVLWKERNELEEECDKDQQTSRKGEISHRAQTEQQQCYVEDLRQQAVEGQTSIQKDPELDQTHNSQQIKDNQQWLLREETWLASLQEAQQEDNSGEEKELEAFVAPDAWLPTVPQTLPSPLVQSQKRVLQLQRLRTRTSRAAVWNIRQKKVSFQLERIIKKRRLLETRRRLEQLRALFWLPDDGASKAPSWVSSSNTSRSGSQRRSRWTACSSLSRRRLCSQRLSRLHSAFMNWDPSTMSPPVPDPIHQIPEKTLSADCIPQATAYPPRTGCLGRNSLHPPGWRRHPARGASTRKGVSAQGTCLTVSHESVSQEIESLSKQSCQMSSQGLATKKLKSRDGSRTHTPAAQTRRAKGPEAAGNTQTGWQKEGSCGTYKAPKETTAHSTYPSGSEQAAGHGKVITTFQTESKPTPPSRASKKHQRVLAARARDIAKKFSRSPHGSSLKRQPNTGDPDTLAFCTDSRPIRDCVREKDNNLSDTDSSYSVDSLSYVYAKVPKERLKPEDLQGTWPHPAQENSESDNSQISEDSLVEKGYHSPPEDSGDEYSTMNHGHSRARISVSVRHLLKPSDNTLCGQAQRSFSLDSLTDAELGEDRQEEPFHGSADEMPTETFWRPHKAALPAVDQEATCTPSPINHRTGVRPDAFLTKNNSFYLDPDFQPHCEQPESEMEASYSEQANSLQGMQLTRESPLVSVDSWFSCDSKVNPSSPSATVHSLCPSPDVHEIQPYDEMPRHRLNIEEVKPPGTVLSPSYKLPQGSTKPPCSSGLYITSASDISKPSVCGSQRFLQPGADGVVQDKEIPDMTYHGISEESHSSNTSSVLDPSATSLAHEGSIHEKDWAALQQKYLLELSNSVLEAVGEPRPAFSYLEEEYSSLAEASDKVDTQLPVDPEVSKNLDFSYFPVHISKIRHLRAEKEHDSLSGNLESASDLFSTIEKGSYNGVYSADLESLTSGSINAQTCTAGNKIPNYMTEAWEVKQTSLEGCLQGSRNPGLLTSSGQYFFQKKAYHNHDILPTKADHWPQDGTLLEKSTVVQPRQSHNSCQQPLLEEKADSQQHAKEAEGTHTDASYTFPSGPELFLHSDPWSPFPSSLQPPSLETFYVTKSRDALTETALEIPACREAWVPSPPPREAWGFGHSYQVLQKANWGNNLPKMSQGQNSKIDASQQVTTRRPTHLNTEVTEEMEQCSRNTRKEGNHDSAYCFFAQNRHHLPSTSLKVCECGNQLGILNKKYSLSVHEEGGGSSAWHHCSVAFDSSESKTLLFICDSKASGEEQSPLPPQIQTCAVHSQSSSGARSDFIGQITNLDLEKVIPEETALPLKSRSLHSRVSSPVIMTGDGSPPHRREGRSETVLLREVTSKDIQEGFSLPGAQHTCERCQLAVCSQKRKPRECKAHGQSQEIKSKEEPLGERQNKRVNSAEEMARLIRSVMQLETDISEIESKQKQQLHASQMPSTEFMLQDLQDLQDQERVDHGLMPGSCGKHSFFENQPSFPIQIEDGIFGDSEAREMEGNNAISNNAQVQKSIGSPFRSREHAQKGKSESEHSHPPPGVDGHARDMSDSLEKDIALREPSNISLHSERMNVLARALPLQPSIENSPEKDDELLKASSDFQDRAWTLESFKEPETMGSVQESQTVELPSDSELEDAKAHRRVEELAMEKGGNLQETLVSLTQKLPTPNQDCKGTFFSQETISPFHNQTGFSSTLPDRELSSTQPLDFPSLPRSCLHASDTKGISSFEYMLEPTMLKINRSSLATGVGHQDYSGGARSSSPQGSGIGDASDAHTAWCESVMPTVMRANDQSVIPESILLETEDWITESTSPQEDQRGDFRVTSTGLTIQEGLGSESEATVQKEIKYSSLDGVSRQAEKRVSFLLQEDSDQGEEERQKEEKSEDQQPASSTSSSLPRAPDPEPLLLPDSSIHASICLAILAEIRQAKAQRKKLNDFVTEETVLPYETSQEGCFSEAAGRPHEQMVKLGWGSTRNENEARGLRMASPAAVSADLLDAEKEVQAMLPSAGNFQHLPSPETDRGPGHHLLASSHIIPGPVFTRESRQFCGASGWSESSEVTETKKETSRTLSFVDPLASDRLLSIPAVEQDGRVGSEKVSVLPYQTSCGDPGRILHGQSRLAAWKTAEGISFGSQDSIPEYQEPRCLDCTCGGGSVKILVTTQEGKAVHYECQSVICHIDNSAGLSGPKKDHVQCSDASTGLEEIKASPTPCAVQPGAPKKAKAEAHMYHPVQWENVDSDLAEAQGADNKNPRSTPLLDQIPSLHLSGARKEAPCLCPKECLVSEGRTRGSRSLDSSHEEEENRKIPQLSGPQPTAVHACCSHASTLPCYRDGVLRKGTPQAAPHPVHSPSIVPYRDCEVDRTVESFPKHKHVHVEPGSVDNSVPNPSTAAAVSSPAQRRYSLATSEVKANGLTHGAAGGRSVEVSEENISGKTSIAPKDVYTTNPAGTHSEPLRTLKDNAVGENAQASQTKPEPPVVTQGPHTLNLNEGSVDGTLVVAAQYGHLENTTRHCSGKTQPSTEVRSYSCLGPQANIIDRLKHTCLPQIETSWEEEEQQREQASGGGKAHVQVRNLTSSNEGGFDGSHSRDSEREEMVVAKSPVSQTLFLNLAGAASPPLGQTEISQPAAPTGQLDSGREQPALCPRRALPVIAVFSGTQHSKYSPRPQFSVISSSRSLQELNLSVASPSLRDEVAQGPKRLRSPLLRGHSLEKPLPTSPKTRDCNQKASCNLNNSPTEHEPLKPVIPPYPSSPTVSCMPTPDFMTNWMPGTLEQAHQGKTDKLSVQGMPKNWHSQVDKEVLHFGSSDINSYVLPLCPQGPVHIGWKQYVFGSAADDFCSQKLQCLIPSNMAQCSSMDSALDDKRSPFHSHIRTDAKTGDQSNMHNNIENDQSSKEGWEIGSPSHAMEKPHILTRSEGVASAWDPDMRLPFEGSSERRGCLGSEQPLAEGSATAAVDKIILLCPPETGCAVGQARLNTFEQGTQTLCSGLHWSCSDISAQSDARTMSDSELASWSSMHSLSLHLSQLLHSTSELLGSLSQPNAVPKEQNIKSDSPDEAPQALMMDGSTQTTVDEGIQTDLALSPLPFQARDVKPQEVSVILEVMDSGITTMVQEKGDVPEVFQKKGAEETESPDPHEGSTHYKPQSPPVPLSHLTFQKAHLGQNLPFVSPPASTDVSSPPSLQPDESSMVVNSSSISHHSGLLVGTSEFTQEPSTQKNLGPSSAVLVDRASSPILTFSASTQELSNPLACVTLSAPSAHPLEDFQEINISPDLAVGNPRPPMDNSQATESGVSQRVRSLDGEGKSPLEKCSEKLVLDSSPPCSPQQNSSLQVSFLGQALQQLQPTNSTGDQSRLPSPPPRHRSLKLDDSFVPEKVASMEHGPWDSRRPSQWQSRTANRDESSVSIVEPQPSLDLSSSWRSLQPLSPCPVSDATGLQRPTVESLQACQPVGLLCPGSHVCVAPDLQHHSLRDLPVHNKFDNWYRVQDKSCGGLHVSENLGVRCDSSSTDQTQRPLQPPDDYNQDPEWLRLERIPLQVGVQKPSLSVELREAKLHRGFGETDALLKVLQSGTGEGLAPQEPAMSSWEKPYTRQKKTIETLRRERAERLHNFRRTRSLSPQKQLSFLPNKDLPTWEFDLPSRRREYLQQLRKDVVETTRIPEPVSRSANLPSDIELMLRDYHQAREEAKVEIAQARDRLRERTEQEKQRIRQQIISQLLKEEEKLQTLANSSSLCTSSSGSLSSGITSGYNSSPAFSGHPQSLEVKEDSRVPDFRDTWIGGWQGRSTVRNSQLYLTGSTWKSLAHSRRASLGSGCCSPSSLSSLGTCFSSPYQDLAKHIVNTSMADVSLCAYLFPPPVAMARLMLDGEGKKPGRLGPPRKAWKLQQLFVLINGPLVNVSRTVEPRELASTLCPQVMAACSDNLHNLFSRQATAGWNYQGEEQEVQFYYKEFSSTRHGFLGAGVVSQPLSHVWAAVSDPTLWPLYHKPIQTARLHQRVSNSISLVYLVCDTTLCALKQLRDFCCVCVEAKEGHLSIMAAQSVYDTSMPRPSRKMVRGEILPSAWVLQPFIMEGKEITRVIFLAQVELGAPGFPPHLLNSFIKQQPLVVAKLASFLGS
ncbi:stAR-related lipid transfer protein 9 isoform X2 [Arvicola amphibius]|uniref:stAR-related lipid transfer protein 9 isoform X2 n=1 Tax=Arvicola amphibius TaxID=1047088 RepID=UPI0018E30274|nr:stAR-related lipid transfer protein 9 isoform X2 [Arvicola amphibius]